MRTLQEKYNGINEGKFTKDQFLRDARMEQPSLVTHYNGYDDAVQILKNRGMIQENDPGSIYYIAKSAASGKYVVNKASKHASQTVTGNQKFKTEAEAQAEADKKNKETIKEARLTNKSLTDYRYKPTNDMDKYPYEQILRGLRVELEGLNVLGTPTPEEYTKALGKVLKNLEKDSIFYTNQVAGVKANAKRTDIMIDATPKNEVDKENGLKKAALKEAIKGVIKNILSEGNEFGEGEDVYEMYGEDEIDYDDENFSDPFIDGDEADDIPHPRGYEEASDEETFEDLFEITDTEADKAMVRKFMTMYETEPSKFERLHKQAETQAATNKDVKYKHLLSLINRAKAGALQSLSNQDKYQASIEGIDESISLFDILDEGSSKHSTEWFKGYRAFNDDKKLSSNPYKESPKKEDWAAGWDQAQSHASDAYKGY